MQNVLLSEDVHVLWVYYNPQINFSYLLSQFELTHFNSFHDSAYNKRQEFRNGGHRFSVFA